MDNNTGKFKVPDAFKAPPAFVAHNLSPELVDDLRQRAEVVADFRMLSVKILEVLEGTVDVAIVEPDAIVFGKLDDYLISHIRNKNSFLKDLDEVVNANEPLFKMAYALNGPERGAWMAYLSPLMQTVAFIHERLSALVKRLSDHAKKVSRVDHDLWPGEAEDERLLNARAAVAYALMAREELNLRCLHSWAVEGGVGFSVVRIYIPQGIDRPRQHYRKAIERIHDRVEDIRADLVGRVTWEFVSDPNGA